MFNGWVGNINFLLIFFLVGLGFWFCPGLLCVSFQKVFALLASLRFPVAALLVSWRDRTAKKNRQGNRPARAKPKCIRLLAPLSLRGKPRGDRPDGKPGPFGEDVPQIWPQEGPRPSKETGGAS